MSRLFTAALVLFSMSAAGALTAAPYPVAASDGAQAVARGVLNRAVAVGAEAIVPKDILRGASAGDVIWVHDPGTLERRYGLVPIVSAGDRVVAVVAVDAHGESALWSVLECRGGKLLPVSEVDAHRRMGETTRTFRAEGETGGRAGSTLGEGVLIEGADGRLYWHFTSGATTWLVDAFDADAAVLDEVDNGDMWAGLTAVSETCFPGSRAMVVGDDGTVHVVWSTTLDAVSDVYYLKRAGGVWSDETRISDSPATSNNACIAQGPDGRLHVAWTDLRGGSTEVYFREWMSGAGADASPEPAGKADIALAAPYPQPFAEEARVAFTLAGASDLTVAVFDVKGELVRLLASGTFDAGAHCARWDGTSASGRCVAPGVYFIRCTGALADASRPVVLVR